MNKDEFMIFYNNCVKVIALRFVKEHSNFRFVDNPLAVYEEYMNQKTMLHVVYGKNEKLLDRHKVCACMTVAIIKTRLLANSYAQTQEFDLAKSSCVNEQLGFLASWELLKGFVIAREEMTNEIFRLPDTFHNVSFIDTITRSLFMANQLNGLGTPLIANIFFLLERYCMDIEE